MFIVSSAARRRIARYYRAVLIPLMILLFALLVALPGCASLDAAAATGTDRPGEAPVGVRG